MINASVDFWLYIGSTYSYLTIMRLEEVSKATGVKFRWRPFSARAIMIEQNNIPFLHKPVKMAYMWRDIERRAQLYGLPVHVPAPYPLVEFDLANRVAVVGAREGWCAEYIRATYRRWFQDGQQPGSEPNLSESLNEIGQRPDQVIASARSTNVQNEYEQATMEAKSLGVFGSPTFVVDYEVFWGDDRLDDAIEWLRHGRLSQRPQIGR